MAMPVFGQSMYVVIAAASAFLVIALVTLALASFPLSDRRQVEQTLRVVSSYKVRKAGPLRKEPFIERLLGPTFETVGEVLRRHTPSGVIATTRRQLALAGDAFGLTVEKFFALKGLIAACFLVLFLPVAATGSRFAIMFIFMSAIGFYLPDLWLRHSGAARQAAIAKALPNTLDLLTISVEAGLGFDAALAKVISAEHDPLGQEFAKTLHEIQIGVTRKEAFRNLRNRTTVSELRNFMTSMIQADEFGMSIGKVLRVQAREMRLSRRQHAEEKAMKLPVKVVFPLILFIFPSIFVIILGPAVISIVKSLGGMD